MLTRWTHQAHVFEGCSTRTTTTFILSSTTASSRPARPGCASTRRRYSSSICMHLCVCVCECHTMCACVLLLCSLLLPVRRCVDYYSVSCKEFENGRFLGDSSGFIPRPYSMPRFLPLRWVPFLALFFSCRCLSAYRPATTTAQECKKFVREHCREGSNPDYPWMQQIFTTLVTWRQLEQYLFPYLRTIWKTAPFRKAAPLDRDRNVFLREVGFVCVAKQGSERPYPLGLNCTLGRPSAG